MNDRKDSWNPSDDLLLSQVVLEYIKTGKTQLMAFEKVSQALGRTSAACGFRWNSALRQNHLESIQEAKLIRHGLKSKSFNKNTVKHESISNSNDEITFEKLMIYLLNFKQEFEELKQKLSEQDKIIQEYESISQKPTNDTLPDDMKNFLRILGKSSIYDNLPDLNDKEPAI